jgi:uroporphyrin-III C-methyltransferase
LIQIPTAILNSLNIKAYFQNSLVMEPVSLLTSIDCTAHIHLIVGSNPLAAARCAKSIQVGAKPILIAPESAELHYALQKRIDSGEVEWRKKSFEENDALSLGREEIGGVVDAVFVTYGPRDPLSMLRCLQISGSHRG